MLPVHQCRTSSYLRHLAVRVLRHRIWHLRPDAVNKGSLVGFFTLQKLRRKAGVGCSDDLPPCPNDQVSMTLRRGPARLLHFAQIVCTSQRIDTSSWVLARMQILPSTRSCVTPIIPVARENRSPSDSHRTSVDAYASALMSSSSLEAFTETPQCKTLAAT